MGIVKYKRNLLVDGIQLPESVPDTATISGWASYIDTADTLADPQTIPANTDTILTINSGTVIDIQKPTDIDTFWDNTNNTVTGRNGDGIGLQLFFESIPSTQNQWIDIWVDIGDDVGELYRKTFPFPKGQGVSRGVNYSLPSLYTLGTWEANGGTFYIRSNGIVTIYDKVLNVHRNHKAR